MNELRKALVAAQAQADSVVKDKRNKFHGYDYASAEAMMMEAKSVLGPHGLALTMRGWRVEHVPGLENARLITRFQLTHSSGECDTYDEISVAVVPEKGRPQDKAEAAALTYLTGYFIRSLLLLPRVAEGEQVDERDDRDDRTKDPVRVQRAGARQPPPTSTGPVAFAGKEPVPSPSEEELAHAREYVASYAKALNASDDPPLTTKDFRAGLKKLPNAVKAEVQQVINARCNTLGIPSQFVFDVINGEDQ